MSTNRSQMKAQALPVVLASAALLLAAGAMGCGDSPTGPSSVMPVPTSSVDEVRDFSGLVDIPLPTTIDLSLGIQRQSVDAAALLPGFFATLFAQETGTVSGTYTIQTVPPRTGVVEGTFDGESFLTAGQFRGMLIEDTRGCIARREYSGPVTAAGVNWVAGATIQPCPSAPFAELRSIVITATGSTQTTPTPGPDPDPDPGQVFTLTVALGGSGGGTVTSSPTGIDCGVDCTEDFAEGTAVTLTPTSDAGSVFAGWTGDGDCNDGVVTMDADRSCTATFDTSTAPTNTLTVTRSGFGTGTVTSSPGGISCGGDCSEDYAQGTVVTLTPTSDAGSVFAGWTGDADCNDGSVTMDTDRACTATFDTSTTPTNNLTVIRSGAGAGTVTSNPTGISCGVACSADYAEGTVVTLTPTANAGSMFAGWTGDADCSDGQVTMNAARTCTATFDLNPLATFTLTVSKTGTGSGTVTTSPAGIDCGSDCTELYDDGTTVTLVPAPASGSTFAGWSGDADCTDGNVTMNAARSCTATFDLIPPNTLAVTIAGTGLGTVTSSPAGISCPGDCNEPYSVGTSVTLTATPDASSTFGGWTGDADCADGMVTMSAAVGCTATFDAVRTLDIIVSGTGTGTVTSSGGTGSINCPGMCSDTFTNGDVVALTPAPGPSSTFAGWSGTGCGSSVTMNSDLTCTATFITRTLTVNFTGLGTGMVVSSGGSGSISCTDGTGMCSDTFTNGDMVTLTATASGSSTFGGWSGTGCGSGNPTTVTMSTDRTCTADFDPPAGTQTLDVLFTGLGTGTVVSSGGSGSISCTDGTGMCSDTFTNGDMVTLTATASGSSTFGGWSGTGCGSGNPTTVTMSTDRTCTADFNPPAGTQTLDVLFTGTGTGTGMVVSSGGSGSINCTDGTGMCSDAFTNGDMVTLTATASGSSTFGGWSGTGCGSGNPTTVTMSTDRTCTADFDPPAGTQTLDVLFTGTGTGMVVSSGGSGSISCTDGTGMCSDTFTNGDMVTLTATASGSSTFGGWSGTGCGSGTAPTTVTMSTDRTCTADFDPPVQHQLDVTVTLSGGATGAVTSSPVGINCSSGTCNAMFNQGTTVTLTAAPMAPSTFAGWTGDCSAAGTNLAAMVTMNAAQSCTATFDPPVQHQLDVTVTLTGGATGTVTSSPGSINCTSGTCVELFNQGTVVTLTAAAGGTFGGWGGACAAAGTNVQAMVTMSMAQACTATFDP